MSQRSESMPPSAFPATFRSSADGSLAPPTPGPGESTLTSARLPPSVRPPASADAQASELEYTQRVLATKLAELRTYQTERETLLSRIAERDARIQRLEASGAERHEKRVRELETELASATRRSERVGELEVELAASRATLRRAQAALEERDARIRALETELDVLARRVAERDSKIGELSAELSESLAWAPEPSDDLTRIKGIGPKYRDALHALGVRSFADIAAWTSADVERVAQGLGTQAARIERGGWVEAARALQGQRVGTLSGSSK